MPADRVPAVQRHVPVDGGGVRVVLAGVDPGQPGLDHGQCRVGQREPGKLDGGDGVPLGLRGGRVTEPSHGPALLLGGEHLVRGRLVVRQVLLGALVEIVLAERHPTRRQRRASVC